MKKHLFYLAAAVVAMSSCTESEVVEMSQSKAIGFDSYVGKTTRGEQTGQDLDVLKEAGKGFYVFGSYQEDGKTGDTEVFDGKSTGSHVTHNGSTWGYSPVNFWLENATYKFAAYAPALTITPTFSYTDNKMTFSNFVADGKTDLLVAEATANGISSTYDPVQFTFKHALSKVRFTFKDGWRNEVKLAITDVKLQNVKSTGTLVTPGTLNAANDGIGLQATDWTVENTTTTYTDKAGATLTEFDTNPYIFDNFVMPQSISGNDLALVFTARVENPNGTQIAYKQSITVPVSTAQINAWLPGNAYNYILTISGETFGLKPIQFEAAKVTNWNDNENEKDITDDVTTIVNPQP